ncbi:MAG: YGGT family protein [Candidatus Cloacimonetes bacterium ADurb.Bin117]|jgi:YggT family protein|nr:MAG: YGGT family protein [Candidatus Cloacimonetes bacterium ADurb.Bin117]
MRIASSFAGVIAALLDLYSLLIIIRALMSWFMQDQSSGIYRWLVKITEPVLSPIRKLLPRMRVDLSPVVAVILIGIVIRIIK